MERRLFLTALAAGTAATLAGCTTRPTAARTTAAAHTDAAGTSLAFTPRHVNPNAVAGVRRVATSGAAAPPPPKNAPTSAAAIIDRLPSDGVRRFALTVDDGVSTEVLNAYVDFVVASGIRLTFFVNGIYDSWQVVRRKLAPLVESGQVQLGNHTWSHPSITGLSSSQITDELLRNDRFLANTYGVSGRPYFRPPYGHHDDRTDAVTGALGFTQTVMWFGSLGDAAILTPAQVMSAAREWFVADRVVIGHANHPAVTYIYPQLVDLIRQRQLQTVTLDDVFGKGVTVG